MKLLYVSHKDITHPKSGGAEVYADIFLRHVALAGHKVDIITSRFSNQDAFEDRGNIRIFRYRGYFGPHLALPVFLIFGKYDLIITDLGHVVPWPSTVFYGDKTISIFYHLHRRTLQGQVSKFGRVILSLLEYIYPFLNKKCFFVTISSTSRNDLVSLGINSKKICIIPPGVDVVSFVPGQKSSHPKMIFFSGLRDYKRPELALDVLRTLVNKYPDFQLLIAGDGPAKERLKERTAKYGLQSNVHFLGRIDRTTLIRYVSESSVNVQFSVSEGFGITIIEASACGTHSEQST